MNEARGIVTSFHVPPGFHAITSATVTFDMGGNRQVEIDVWSADPIQIGDRFTMTIERDQS